MKRAGITALINLEMIPVFRNVKSLVYFKNGGWVGVGMWGRVLLFFFNPVGNTYYLLTPWCRFLLQKLTGLQLVKKFPAFNGTRRFPVLTL